VFYHRQFALQYVQRFQNAVFDYVINAPDAQIRKLKKERFDKILKLVEKLIKRVYTIKEKNEVSNIS